MSNLKQIVARTISLLDPRRIKFVTEKDHPLYDERIEEPLAAATLAKYRLGDAYVPPVVVISPENAELLGYPLDRALYDALIWQGRQRTRYSIEANVELIEAFFREAKSIEDYNLKSVEENTHRLEMTFDQQVAKARRFYAAGITDIAALASCFNKAESTVRTWLDVAEMAEKVPAFKASLDSGELNTGIGNQLAKETPEVVTEVMRELAKVQTAALTKAVEEGKTEGRVSTPEGNATLTKNAKGETVAVPSQDTVQQTKAKVKGKKAPESTKKEADRKVAVPLDASLLGMHKAKLDLLARMGDGQNYADLIAGASFLLALATNATPALADDASEAVKAAHAALFAPKA
jgi:hypothetical protein